MGERDDPVIPDERLSTTTVARQFWFPRNIPRQSQIDYEYGGVDINDATQGRRVKVWKGEYIEGFVTLSAADVAPVPFLEVADLFDFAFTFDSNMNPFIAYELLNGTARFYWFDSTIPGYTTTTLPSGSKTVRCAIDDNRDLQTGASDIILAYCRAGSLYFRAQRERYLEEHLLSNAVGTSGLIQIGMNKGLRFQFQLSTASDT